MKISALGVKGNMLKWICSFLSDRKEVVMVDGVKSKLKTMKSYLVSHKVVCFLSPMWMTWIFVLNIVK